MLCAEPRCAALCHQGLDVASLQDGRMGTKQISVAAFSLCLIYLSCVLQGEWTAFTRWRALGSVQWPSMITKEVSLLCRQCERCSPQHGGPGSSAGNGRWWLTPAVVEGFGLGWLNVFLMESRRRACFETWLFHCSPERFLSLLRSVHAGCRDGGWVR